MDGYTLVEYGASKAKKVCSACTSNVKTCSATESYTNTCKTGY